MILYILNQVFRKFASTNAEAMFEVNMNEKRQHERIALRAHVKLVHPEGGEHNVEMRDMSNGGVFLHTSNKHEFPVGAVVQVQALNIDDAPVITARVVRHDSNGIGLMFIEE